ncbi:hypothetical protein EV689_104188 [Avibacterium gallinarum]|uniref:Uncharacterized protein n=1 Tax=Avibacterium gallinarum TaxID=755 RepID=A0A379AW46_AVIGA|nr:hypothetical protein EV689_104188 [Avibacterium gallinarum]SUB26294.1 Uncharacterised protein [Avibacterium gallinarum]
MSFDLTINKRIYQSKNAIIHIIALIIMIYLDCV